MKLKQILLVVAVSAASAVGSVIVYNKINPPKSDMFVQAADGKLPVNYAGFFDNVAGAADPIDFTKASHAAVPAVVHIKTKIPAKKVSNQLPRNRGNNSMQDLFEQFFGDDMYNQRIQPEQRASGSGVIISEDGYIVTNNHVISDGGEGIADEIMVTLNTKKTYKARVIGKDPSSDLAVLKIDGKGLPFLLYGNSDNVKLGQWVLAIGYPLSLETTVTAGIVSAKGRSIGINSRQSNTPVESFIQTDAAVNQGNSGGALINTDGQLVGINSAIYAPTGTYAGYSFAIPVNIVKKIVNDLIQYGDVKRGFIGISYPSNENENDRLVKQAGLADGQGVYVLAVPTDGAAAITGLKKGDIITKVNGTPVASGLEMSAQVASFKPGDKLPITYYRNNKEYDASITLKESAGSVDQLAVNTIAETLGAELENLDKKKATAYSIEGGVLVKKIKTGGAFSKTRMQEGFVITSVNDTDITNLDELTKVLQSSKGGSIYFEGIYPEAPGAVYRYPLILDND
ncbi:MAG TPA: trypsin-like peptidase domain-containing protein [Chitinophagaceae bacterium]|nr:trypsin-like peptidase domain-containing protein [Chitinophagaceae bacterium]